MIPSNQHCSVFSYSAIRCFVGAIMRAVCIVGIFEANTHIGRRLESELEWLSQNANNARYMKISTVYGSFSRRSSTELEMTVSCLFSAMPAE